MVGSGLQPDFVQYGCPWIFLFLYDVRDLDYPHRHAAFPVRLTRLFAHVLCNSPYGLKQTQNMSGSVLLTTEASQLSVWIAEVAYYIENPKTTSKRIIFMELFDILEMLRKLAILCK